MMPPMMVVAHPMVVMMTAHVMMVPHVPVAVLHNRQHVRGLKRGGHSWCCCNWCHQRRSAECGQHSQREDGRPHEGSS
jgi:hypothetical protein